MPLGVLHQLFCHFQNLSDGDSCASDHSSSTEYEPVEGENLYEDPEVLELSGSDKRKDDDKKSLGVKLKKNVDKATHYLNKIGTKFNKKRGKVHYWDDF